VSVILIAPIEFNEISGAVYFVFRQFLNFWLVCYHLESSANDTHFFHDRTP